MEVETPKKKPKVKKPADKPLDPRRMIPTPFEIDMMMLELTEKMNKLKILLEASEKIHTK